MSTEKDREAVIAIAAKDRGTDEWTVKDILDNCPAHPWYPRIKEVVGFVNSGIQHARQGERERLVCFAERIRIFLRDYSGVHSYAHEINVVINDFLEQEKSR